MGACTLETRGKSGSGCGVAEREVGLKLCEFTVFHFTQEVGNGKPENRERRKVIIN